MTNVETVNRQIKKLKDLERRMASGELESRYSKLEVQRFQEEIDELNANYGGIKDMSELLPGHGGLMDRLDGMLPSAAVAWIFFILAVL